MGIKMEASDFILPFVIIIHVILAISLATFYLLLHPDGVGRDTGLIEEETHAH